MQKERQTPLSKMLKYCAYQDRCLSEVKTKMATLKLDEPLQSNILKLLIEEQYVDDARYAMSFVRGRVNLKHWGINKIRFALRQKGIADEIIADALQIIDADVYKDELLKLLKNKNIKDTDSNMRKRKLAQYALQKGYQSVLVWEVLNEMERGK